ncbi:hypothetical protein JJL56_32615 [Azospirillum sp. YIM DDC1]|uniref:Lipoprotein n=1 Tax=Azospirillum aestuarii TaxID=2802052 RepID=A0ABS1I998_9PROT|nr:hypothetical protein [Azospirillum aestuarii]MBK4723585.1 hypothetical protein [Azospirillum aestuarii]
MRLPLYALLLVAACTANPPALVKLPDGTDAYALRANSSPFQAGQVSEEEVIAQGVRDQNLCPNGHEIVSKRNVAPGNYSLVIMDALVRCR